MENNTQLTVEKTLESMLSDQSVELLKSINDQIELVKTKKNNTEINQMVVATAQANVVKQLKAILTDPFVMGIKQTLENSSLGFKTDKTDGYPVNVIRTCLIESALNGFYWHGNEFNIIAGNTYFTKDGLRNKMRRDNIYSDLKISFGVPDHDMQKKRALIVVSASWRVGEKQYNIEETISVKIQVKDGVNFTTDDAVIGKANRKIRARIIEMVTGDAIPEGDDDEFSNEIKGRKEVFPTPEIETAEIQNAEIISASEITKPEPETVPADQVPDAGKPITEINWESAESIIGYMNQIDDAGVFSAFKKKYSQKFASLPGDTYTTVIKALNEKQSNLK